MIFQFNFINYMLTLRMFNHEITLVCSKRAIKNMLLYILNAIINHIQKKS